MARKSRDGRTGWCKSCKKEYGRGRYLTNPERVKAANQAWHDANPRRRADWYLKRQFGISLETYEGMFTAQGGNCAVCGKSETVVNRRTGNPRRLAVDHDHKCCPGRRSCGQCVRGLLCDRCNRVLGQARDDLALLDHLVRFLRRVA